MSQPGGNNIKRHRIGSLNVFFQAVRQTAGMAACRHERPSTPATHRPSTSRRTAGLAEFVMTQIESPANLDRWADPSAKLVTLILTRYGLRVSSVLSLAFDWSSTTGKAPPTCATSTPR